MCAIMIVLSILANANEDMIRLQPEGIQDSDEVYITFSKDWEVLGPFSIGTRGIDGIRASLHQAF